MIHSTYHMCRNSILETHYSDGRVIGVTENENHTIPYEWGSIEIVDQGNGKSNFRSLPFVGPIRPPKEVKRVSIYAERPSIRERKPFNMTQEEWEERMAGADARWEKGRIRCFTERAFQEWYYGNSIVGYDPALVDHELLAEMKRGKTPLTDDVEEVYDRNPIDNNNDWWEGYEYYAFDYEDSRNNYGRRKRDGGLEDL